MSGIERQRRIERTVAEWAASGLNSKAMAARAGVSVSTLWRWKSRHEGTGGRVPRAAASTSRFLPVRVVESGESQPSKGDEDGIEPERDDPFELVFPDGARLVIPSCFAADGLSKLLTVLRTC